MVVELSVQFHSANFGFKEVFSTPNSGKPQHVKLQLDQLILGLASIKSAEEMQRLKVGADFSKKEIVLRIDDIDADINSFYKTMLLV